MKSTALGWMSGIRSLRLKASAVRGGIVLVDGLCDWEGLAVPLFTYRAKAVPLHAMKALRGRGGVAPTHTRSRHWMG
jgi:hypothetical protein